MIGDRAHFAQLDNAFRRARPAGRAAAASRAQAIRRMAVAQPAPLMLAPSAADWAIRTDHYSYITSLPITARMKHLSFAWQCQATRLVGNPVLPKRSTKPESVDGRSAMIGV